MSSDIEKNILILGLGNLLLSDEGIGVHVVRRLQQMELPPEVEVIDGGTGGLELIEHVRGKSKVVIVDCLQASAEPGSIMQLSLDDVANQRYVPMSAHQGGVLELFNFIRTLTPVPEVVVYGVVPAVTNRIDMQLSRAVESQMKKIISIVLGEARVAAGAHV
jgi:hydrogenase maturation protease